MLISQIWGFKTGVMGKIHEYHRVYINSLKKTNYITFIDM